MYKSIFSQENLALNEDGRKVDHLCQQKLKEVFEQFPDLNPREVAHVICQNATYVSAMNIVKRRREKGQGKV